MSLNWPISIITCLALLFCIGFMCSGYIQNVMQLAKKALAGRGCCSPLNISPG